MPLRGSRSVAHRHDDVASVKVRDGLVLASDSMTQVTIPSEPPAPPQWAKAYANARKLFQLADLPVGVVT